MMDIELDQVTALRGKTHVGEGPAMATDHNLGFAQGTDLLLDGHCAAVQADKAKLTKEPVFKLLLIGHAALGYQPSSKKYALGSGWIAIERSAEMPQKIQPIAESVRARHEGVRQLDDFFGSADQFWRADFKKSANRIDQPNVVRAHCVAYEQGWRFGPKEISQYGKSCGMIDEEMPVV